MYRSILFANIKIVLTGLVILTSYLFGTLPILRSAGADTEGSQNTLIQAGETIGTPTISKTLLFDPLEGSELIRFGDLNGDGTSDILLARHKGQKIRLLTAMTLDGEILWHRGKIQGDHSGVVFSDLAVQIFDINQDGDNEVIVVMGKFLRVLSGRTGKTLQKVRVTSDARDSIAFAQLDRGTNPYSIILKNRYSKFWVYSHRLREQYERTLRTGHYPVEYDIDGDGRDEFLMGYTLFRANGRPIWRASRIKRHNDAADINDVDGDGIPEIAIASSGDSYLLDKDGNTLWKQDHRHSQHAIISRLNAGSSGERQVSFIERPTGNVYTYDKDGSLLWKLSNLGKITMASAVSGWSDAHDQEFLMIFRMTDNNPSLINGDGHVVAEFPFPLAGTPESGLSKHFVHHFDIVGDHREEIIIHNEQGLVVYENSEPASNLLFIQEAIPNRRMYNSTFYIGSQ
ncbi:MAG: hypothetical protein ACO3XO_03995 [Bdellovibrionota bacterium]